jgi:hypothetical protein
MIYSSRTFVSFAGIRSQDLIAILMISFRTSVFAIQDPSICSADKLMMLLDLQLIVSTRVMWAVQLLLLCWLLLVVLCTLGFRFFTLVLWVQPFASRSICDHKQEARYISTSPQLLSRLSFHSASSQSEDLSKQLCAMLLQQLVIRAFSVYMQLDHYTWVVHPLIFTFLGLNALCRFD